MIVSLLWSKNSSNICLHIYLLLANIFLNLTIAWAFFIIIKTIVKQSISGRKKRAFFISMFYDSQKKKYNNNRNKLTFVEVYMFLCYDNESNWSIRWQINVYHCCRFGWWGWKELIIVGPIKGKMMMMREKMNKKFTLVFFSSLKMFTKKCSFFLFICRRVKCSFIYLLFNYWYL